MIVASFCEDAGPCKTSTSPHLLGFGFCIYPFMEGVANCRVRLNYDQLGSVGTNNWNQSVNVCLRDRQTLKK